MDEITTINVGKNGLTDALIGEIRSMLHKKKKLRIKFLKSARASSDRKSLAEEVVAKSRGKKVSLRGNILLLSKR